MTKLSFLKKKKIWIPLVGVILLVGAAIPVTNVLKNTIFQPNKNEELGEVALTRAEELRRKIARDNLLLKSPVNVTDRLTGIELEVKYDEKKPSHWALIRAMHHMTHQKISADNKQGAIPMTYENIIASQEYLKLVRQSGKVGYEEFRALNRMLGRWETGKFALIDQEQDSILDMLNASFGYSNGIATPEEEELFILNNYGEEYLFTMDKPEPREESEEVEESPEDEEKNQANEETTEEMDKETSE